MKISTDQIKEELFIYRPAFISWDLQWKINWHGSFSTIKTTETSKKNSKYQNLACGRTFCFTSCYNFTIMSLYCKLWPISHTHYIPCVVLSLEDYLYSNTREYTENSQREWGVLKTQILKPHISFNKGQFRMKTVCTLF